MAIYHFSAKMISRANGSSALASAAYRSASRLHDRRLDRHHDFSNKTGVVHSEVMLPDSAPEHLSDRETLWNEVEAVEKRIDGQLAREIEFAIPRELTKEQGIELARAFVRDAFVSRGMIADLNLHWDMGVDGLAKPHAHVMLTTRQVGEEGFGPKNRDWNRTDLLQKWRERWAEHVNTRLAELDIDARVDHRSLEAQGIELEPQHKIGPAASRMVGQGLESERLAEHAEIARENGERIIANPRIALDAITHHQATFTRRDFAMFAHRHSDGLEQFERVRAAVRASPDLVALGKDGRGEMRFTSRQMLETEQRLERATAAIDERDHHGIADRHREAALARAQDRGMVLSSEQRNALEHVTEAKGLGIIIGYAGTGKSAMLGVARDAWEAAGYDVRGAALSGIAAENLESGSGIASRTIASIEHHWEQGRDLLDRNSVLIIDEAGMIGTRQMERVVSEAEKRGAKVVLVGDPEQLQAIEAGAAFRVTAERHGGVEITQIRRQHDDWQRDATRHLATGRTADAVAAYQEHSNVHVAETREQARGDLIERWDRDRAGSPGASRMILTHTNDEVRDLNLGARERLRANDQLGEDITIVATRGDRQFANGDRVMFLKNDRDLGVKNGTLGTVETVSRVRMAVQLDDGRSVAFDLKNYADVDHGYAATIHKAQGMTVDRVHVLATPGMDSHSAYVALSRHREGVDLHYGKDDFADQGKLVRALSRERSKDMASDYQAGDKARAFAERRGITFAERVVEAVRSIVPEPIRDLFKGQLSNVRAPERERERAMAVPEQTAPAVSQDVRIARRDALLRHAKAVDAIYAGHDRGREMTPRQKQELKEARSELNALRPDAARDMENAFRGDRTLVDEAAGGKLTRAVQAMQLETEIRTDPKLRADRFVERWQQLDRQTKLAYADGRTDDYTAIQKSMSAMAEGLSRDPQLESLLAIRKQELGIAFSSGRSLGAELVFNHALDLGIGRGLGGSRVKNGFAAFGTGRTDCF